MSKLYKGRQPRSTIGRFLLDVIKPAPTLSSLGKRSRDDPEHDKASVNLDPGAPPAPAPSRAPEPRLTLEPRPARVALQHEDTSEDAIVITALDIAPFCCHADLLMMSRAQLLAVAASMNAKLPRTLQIDTSARPAAAIRHSIELLVGIRTQTAPNPDPELLVPAPRVQSAVRPGPAAHSHLHLGLGTPSTTPLRARGGSAAPSPNPRPSPGPVSPLASRTRPSASLGAPSLAVLREDPEEARPYKRRRQHAQNFRDLGPIGRAHARRVTPFLAHAQAQAESTPNRDGPRRMHTRSQSGRGAHAANTNTSADSIPRMQSTSTSTSKGRSKSRSRSSGRGVGMTSTPKRARAAVNSPGGATVGRRLRPLLAEVGNVTANTGTAGMAARAPSTWRDCQYGMDMSDMTFGLDGLTMPMADSGEQ
ncbi:hypothetical protein C8Q80DRAFT_1354556 [Daedaleopsis nitida]|nr:hypothetical protein C8Q80DRAFT_1354556 [Daedaleopsis nitida]